MNSRTSLSLLAALLLAGGCATNKRPFDDVTSRRQNDSTLATAQGTPAPQTQPAAEQPKPAMEPVVAQATRPANAVAAAETPAQPQTPPPPPAPSASTLSTQHSALSPTTQPAMPIAYVRESPGLIQRQWPLAVNFRPSGDSLTGHVYGFPLPLTHDKRPEWQQGMLDPVEFFTAVVLAPLRMVQNPPWTTTVTSPANDQDWTPMGPANTADAR